MLEALLRTRLGSRLMWRLRWGGHRARARPPPLPENAVLKTRAQWQSSVRLARGLGLPAYHDAPKNWDSLAALSAILRRTGPEARVLDAGAAPRAVILPWLALYGYRDLVGINLELGSRYFVGRVAYEHGDITATRFADASFDAIACLSVVEHGVELGAYFREMARVLAPGGVLVTSTDYWHEPVDTGGKRAWGAPVRVFTRADIEAAIATAERAGLSLTGPLELDCLERAVHWRGYDLRYTFLVFTLEKR
jgi:SAM-dependent methyltransferase